jgi:4-aminobutyrate aminotransferase-like enzyme/Ser/Thr protein kinase RdoA (MazF antagonist)
VEPAGRAERPLSEGDATRLAASLYGLDAWARALPGEFDDNFRLTAADGRSFVLKAMHPARERGLVAMQCAALAHLEARAPHLPLPRVVLTRSGDAVTETPAPDGAPRLVWMLSWCAGETLAAARPRSRETLAALGRVLGEMDRALSAFDHPAARRELPWNLSRAAQARASLDAVADPLRRALAGRALERFEREVAPALPGLRRQVIHGDANDHNVVLGDPRALPRTVSGLVDFGDMHHGLLAAEPAIAAAYAILGEDDPLAAAAAVVGGYHEGCPLEDEEIGLLLPLMAARLAVSVVVSASRARAGRDDHYARVSETPAWEALERLDRLNPRFAEAALRHACGRPPLAHGPRLAAWLGRVDAASVLDLDVRGGRHLFLDLGIGSAFLGADPRAVATPELTRRIFGAMREAGAAFGVGRYAETRGIYRSPLFAGARPTDERRTVHLGIDLFVEPGAVVRAPLAGVVELLANNRAPQDYGPLVVLRHESDDATVFFSLYGHLSEDTLAGLAVGRAVARGEAIGRVGEPPANGDWPPHLHFQLILDLLGRGADFPGVALPGERGLWEALSPDPDLLLRIPLGPAGAPLARQVEAPASGVSTSRGSATAGPAPGAPATGVPRARGSADDADSWTAEETLAARRRLLGPNLSVSYRKPLKIVRGFRQHLYDDAGRAYLDVYNNVPLVGHSHPRVVRAVQDQIALLNTNTRYLHDLVVRYARRLTRLLPEPLRVCWFVSSGSEANELALRLARAATGGRDVIVLEHAYHGHTTTLVDLSPYKFAGPGGEGQREWVHVAPLPDPYRGPFRRDDPRAGSRYADAVGRIASGLAGEGRQLAAFLSETMPSVAGQVVFPPGYLAEAYGHVRGAGGVAIADEVQTGFGRLGEAFWGFETQGAVPDIVVLGKPIGNGFPLGAVVTSREVASAFDNGMEFFATFGGNPVACAAGLAVLDVLEEEGLQENARRVGGRLASGLRELQARHAVIGDVRGAGLFLGVELVRDRGSLEPATEEAAYVTNRLRERGVLTGTDGPFENVLKLRPPLVFSDEDVAVFLSILDEVLQEDGARVP